MRGYNKVVMLGHLASDPDFRQTKSGRYVANFPIAVNRIMKGEDGEVSEAVDFHRAVAWGGLAETVDKHLAKGSAVFIEGRLVNSSYVDSNEVRHYKTEVVIDHLNIITWKKSDKPADAPKKLVGAGK